MKNLKFMLLTAVIAAGLGFAGCSDSSKTDTTDKTSTEQTSGGEVVTISLPTIQCNTCKSNIKKAFKDADGVNDVDVNVKEKTVKISYDKTKTDLSKIESTITSAGYDANDKKADPNAYEGLDDCCKKPEDQKEKGMHNM